MCRRILLAGNWPGTLLLTVILWVFTSFKSIYNCEDKRSIWRDLEYRKTYYKSVRTHIVCDARTKQNVKHGRDLIAADVCTILIHVFEVFYWANTSNQSNNWDHSLVKYLLRHSLFSLGCVSYRQIQGASMGSQWAPVVCSLVALHREHTYSMPFGLAIFSGKLFSSFRYCWQPSAFGSTTTHWSPSTNLLLEFRLLHLAHSFGRSTGFWCTWIQHQSTSTYHYIGIALGHSDTHFRWLWT